MKRGLDQVGMMHVLYTVHVKNLVDGLTQDLEMFQNTLKELRNTIDAGKEVLHTIVIHCHGDEEGRLFRDELSGGKEIKQVPEAICGALKIDDSAKVRILCAMCYGEVFAQLGNAHLETLRTGDPPVDYKAEFVAVDSGVLWAAETKDEVWSQWFCHLDLFFLREALTQQKLDFESYRNVDADRANEHSSAWEIINSVFNDKMTTRQACDKFLSDNNALIELALLKRPL